MKTGDTVTYAQTRETQSVQPERRNDTGRVGEIAIIEHDECAQVFWSWAPDVGFWVKTRWLQVIN